jgi:membrane protein YdbS with pleckstrin-like domain
MSSGLRDPAQRVSPRAKAVWTLEALTGSAVLLVVAWVSSVLFGWWHLPTWGWALLVAALAAYVGGMPPWRYAVHRWEVTDTAVYTQTGWWTQERRIAPMSRIQTVDHEVGALERLFGLASVTVTTASAAGALRIVGLDRDQAFRLSEQLTRQAQATEDDAT